MKKTTTKLQKALAAFNNQNIDIHSLRDQIKIKNEEILKLEKIIVAVNKRLEDYLGDSDCRMDTKREVRLKNELMEARENLNLFKQSLKFIFRKI